MTCFSLNRHDSKEILKKYAKLFYKVNKDKLNQGILTEGEGPVHLRRSAVLSSSPLKQESPGSTIQWLGRKS